MENQTQQILNELRAIRVDIKYIKQNVVDMDTILTPEEETRLNESLDEFKQGRTTPLIEFEKEIQNA